MTHNPQQQHQQQFRFEPFARYDDFNHNRGGPSQLSLAIQRNLRGRAVTDNTAATNQLIRDLYIPTKDDDVFSLDIVEDHYALDQHINDMGFEYFLPPNGLTEESVKLLRRQFAARCPNKQQTVEWLAEYWVSINVPENWPQILEQHRQEQERNRLQQSSSSNLFGDFTQQQPQRVRTTFDRPAAAAASGPSKVDAGVHAAMYVSSLMLEIRQNVSANFVRGESTGGNNNNSNNNNNNDDDDDDDDYYGDDVDSFAGGDDDGNDLTRFFGQDVDRIEAEHGADDDDQDDNEQQPRNLGGPLIVDTGLRDPCERAIGGRGGDARNDEPPADAAIGGAAPIAGPGGRMRTTQSTDNYVYRCNRLTTLPAIKSSCYLDYSISIDCHKIPPDVQKRLLKMTTDADVAAAVESALLALQSVNNPTASPPAVVQPDYSFIATDSVIKKHQLFDFPHPLFLTHCQCSRNTVIIPKLAGTMMRGISAASSPIARRDAFAESIGLLVCPFDATTPPAVRNWGQLEEWIKGLDVANSLLDRSHLAYIHQLSSLYVPREMQQLLALWRLKNASNQHQAVGNAFPRVADPYNLHPRAIFNHDQIALSNDQIVELERARQLAAVRAERVPTTADNNVDSGLAKFNAYFSAVDEHRRRVQADNNNNNGAYLGNFLARIHGNRTEAQCKAVLISFVDLAAAALLRAAEQQQKPPAAPAAQPPDAAAAPKEDDAAALLLKSLTDNLERLIATLSPEQSVIFEIVKKNINERDSAGAVPTRIAIHGRGGSGKSHLGNVIYDWCLLTHGLKAWFCAFTGCAAQLLRDGRTINSMFVLRVSDKSTTFSNDYKQWPKINTANDAGAHARKSLEMRGAGLVFMDEMSMIGAQMLHHTFRRIEQWSDRVCTAPGFPFVILAGDFFQLKPVGMPSLLGPVNATPAPNAQWGRDFFQFNFGHFFLSTQQRGIGDQVKIMDQMTKNYQLGQLLFDNYEWLDPNNEEDVRLFADATIIVQLNRLRRQLNISAGQRYASRKGVPLITWRRVVTGVVNPETDPIYTDPNSMYWAFFVPDAPAMILANICTTMKASNGTLVRMHSLTWSTEDKKDEALEMIRRTPVGERCIVPTPSYVNCVFTSPLDLSAALGPHDPSLLTAAEQQQAIATNRPLYAYVLPIHAKKVYDDKSNSTSNKKNPNAINIQPEFAMHCIDLAFAVTFYKIQGQTLGRVIIDMNYYSAQLLLAMLYVGFSRVRNVDDVRMLVLFSAKQHDAIARLTWGDHVWTFYTTLQKVLHQMELVGEHRRPAQLIRGVDADNGPAAAAGVARPLRPAPVRAVVDGAIAGAPLTFAERYRR